jgi:hypothetical protein
LFCAKSRLRQLLGLACNLAFSLFIASLAFSRLLLYPLGPLLEQLLQLPRRLITRLQHHPLCIFLCVLPDARRLFHRICQGALSLLEPFQGLRLAVNDSIHFDRCLCLQLLTSDLDLVNLPKLRGEAIIRGAHFRYFRHCLLYRCSRLCLRVASCRRHAHLQLHLRLLPHLGNSSLFFGSEPIVQLTRFISISKREFAQNGKLSFQRLQLGGGAMALRHGSHQCLQLCLQLLTPQLHSRKKSAN